MNVANTTWSDALNALFVHLTLLLWVGPLVPGVVGPTAAIAGYWQYTVGVTVLDAFLDTGERSEPFTRSFIVVLVSPFVAIGCGISI